MSKPISLQEEKPLNNFNENRTCTKYLAVTLLVVGILAATAALLFQFQFKSTSFVIGFGVGSGIALIASGVLFCSKPQSKPRSETQKEAHDNLLNQVKEWSKNIQERDARVWKERYALCQSYWEKFGINKEAIEFLSQKFPKQAPSEEFLRLVPCMIIGRDIENDRDYSGFVRSMFDNDLGGAKTRIRDFPEGHKNNQLMILQAVKLFYIMGKGDVEIADLVAKFHQMDPEDRGPVDELTPSKLAAIRNKLGKNV